MGKLIIINGSPRASKSNSKKYAEVFKEHYKGEILEYNIVSKKHEDLFEKINEYSDILFIFPLYVNSIPAVFTAFLKSLEEYKIDIKPTIHVLINCGFIESEQNFIAVEIIKFFARQNGYPFGSTLCIGGGEAIMGTPFAFLAKRKIKKFANSINNGKKSFYTVTMPLTKKLFIKASTNYWIKYGERNGITREEMETMKIE